MPCAAKINDCNTPLLIQHDITWGDIMDNNPALVDAIDRFLNLWYILRCRLTIDTDESLHPEAKYPILIDKRLLMSADNGPAVQRKTTQD